MSVSQKHHQLRITYSKRINLNLKKIFMQLMLFF